MPRPSTCRCPTACPTGAQTLTAVASERDEGPVPDHGHRDHVIQSGGAVPAQTSCGLQISNPADRLLDTRVERRRSGRRSSPGNTLRLDVAGKYGIAADATAVVLNLTSVNVTDDGWIRAFPCGTPPTGEASNLNPGADRIVANLADRAAGQHRRGLLPDVDGE